MSRILLLTDYRGAFWASTRNAATLSTLDVSRISSELTDRGHTVQVSPLADPSLLDPDVTGAYAIYTSSEDTNLLYKRYIEAQITGLRLAGVHVIPDPELLYAHHDKIMMEVVRRTRLAGTPGQLLSQTFGTFEDFERAWVARPDVPVVLKPSYGAGSSGVALARTSEAALRLARRLSRSYFAAETTIELARRFRRPTYAARSLHRRGFVVQEFLPGLSGDLKVLRYGRRFYVIRRGNRPGDFRASGSGRLTYSPDEIGDITAVLDAALVWSDSLGSPYASLDIAYAPTVGIEPHLIEFQCVNFGPAAAENSVGYYARGPSGWQFVEEPCDLEGVFAEATSDFIASHLHRPEGA